MLTLTQRVDPRPIAIVRICLGLAGLINTLELFVINAGLSSGKLTVPYFGWVPPITPTATLVMMAIGVTATVMIIAGIGTAGGSVVYSLTTATVLLWDQQSYSSHQVLVVLLVAYLAFAESDRAFSPVRRSGPRPDVPWWPQLLMMTQLSALYLFAGLSKINHEFLSGDPLSTWVGDALPGWIFPPMAAATVVTEALVLAVGLWVPRLRVISVVVGVCLHLSILVLISDGVFNLLQLIAFALACVPLYLLYLTRPSLRRAGRTGIARATQEAPRPTGS